MKRSVKGPAELVGGEGGTQCPERSWIVSVADFRPQELFKSHRYHGTLFDSESETVCKDTERRIRKCIQYVNLIVHLDQSFNCNI